MAWNPGSFVAVGSVSDEDMLSSDYDTQLANVYYKVEVKFFLLNLLRRKKKKKKRILLLLFFFLSNLEGPRPLQ